VEHLRQMLRKNSLLKAVSRAADPFGQRQRIERETGQGPETAHPPVRGVKAGNG